MPDLLTHVLAAYVGVTVVSWRHRPFRPYVPVAMVGAVLPDLAKIRLVLGADTVSMALGLPFSWYPVHRLGGVVVLAGVGAILFVPRLRRRSLAFLLAGGTTGLLLDIGLKRANGIAPPYLYPLTWWQPPAGGLYLSSDYWPAVVAITLAGIVWYLDRDRPVDGT